MVSPPARIRLAHLPTPIEPMAELRAGLWIKRDDYSGCELSGNKVRKLEYLVADAVDQDADTLVTAGDVQSNHARATAVVAARLGLQSVLVLEGEASKEDWARGNAFIGRLVGAKIDWQPTVGALPFRLEACRQRLEREGRRPYVIPIGGSNELGLWGYIEAAREAKEQSEKMGIVIDRIVCAAGSCGTFAGLLLGCRLASWPVRVTGISISSSVEKKRAWIRTLLARTVERYDLQVDPEPAELVELYDYAGSGYGQSSPEEMRSLVAAAARGLVLDPVYTGKAFHGLLELSGRGLIAAGERVLFFHTGGILGLLAKAERALNAIDNQTR